MVPEEVAAAGPGPPSPHHHSALKPHDSVPRHWSPVHTAPSPETVRWTKNYVFWQNEVCWHIYKQFMEKYLSPWPVCPSEPVWQLSQCRPLLSARPAWPLLSTTGPRCLCLQCPPLSQHPPQELQLSCSVPERGLSGTENTSDRGVICLSGSQTERSILTECSAVVWSETDWREDVATDILIWSNSRGSSVFNHLQGRMLLSPATLMLVYTSSGLTPFFSPSWHTYKGHVFGRQCDSIDRKCSLDPRTVTCSNQLN